MQSYSRGVWTVEIKDWMLIAQDNNSTVSNRYPAPDWTTYWWNEQGRAVKVPKMSLEDQVKDLLG